MNWQAAITFVTARGSSTEQARLRYLLDGERPTPEVVHQLLSGQREDGGWSPFWATDYSSLDATCFRLAQAEQLGLTANEAAIDHALAFLAQRQHDDGSWEEEEHVAVFAPPWSTPGDLAARLYLTANCGFWSAILADTSANAQRAAVYLQAHLNEDDYLPTFLHARWLAGGLWYRLHWQMEAQQIFNYLQQQLPTLLASNLAWLMTTLLLAGVPMTEPLIEQAASLLAQSQEQDGRWPSEDGPERDVHATLEAMRALRLCGYMSR